MASRPALLESSLERSIENLQATIFLTGFEFEAGASLFIGASSVATTLLSDTRIQAQIPDTLAVGRQDLQLFNVDGGRSNTLRFEVIKGKSRITVPFAIDKNKYVHPRIDQQQFLLPPPFNMRTDFQRIASGSQFNGRIPDIQDQGKFLGGGSPPTTGGRWAYREDVLIKQLDFMVNGVETRSAGSGWFVRRGSVDANVATPHGVEILTVTGSDQYVVLTSPFFLKQGDTLLLFTVDAALEMIAGPTVEIERPYV